MQKGKIYIFLTTTHTHKQKTKSELFHNHTDLRQLSTVYMEDVETRKRKEKQKLAAIGIHLGFQSKEMKLLVPNRPQKNGENPKESKRYYLRN